MKAQDRDPQPPAAPAGQPLAEPHAFKRRIDCAPAPRTPAAAPPGGTNRDSGGCAAGEGA